MTVGPREWAALHLIALPLRLVLFAAAQILVFLAAVAAGDANAWTTSIAWWPLSVTLANVATIGVLIVLMRLEGRSYRDLAGNGRISSASDVWALLGAVILIVPLALLPNLGLAALLFGSPDGALPLFVLPLPRWAIWVALFAFPISIALSELPLYFGYVMPRLRAVFTGRHTPIILPSLFLAAQHVALPIVADGRFVLWRLLMFLPLAVFLGYAIDRRPRFLPWLMVVHGLLDASVIVLML